MNEKTNTSNEEVNRHIAEIIDEMENPFFQDLKKTQEEILKEKKSFHLIE